MFPKKILFIFIVLCLALNTFAQENAQYHLKLLAVQESENGYEGSDADLYLELKEGSGRVFLETFPLTKMDTQISTRFAKEVACNHFKIDCSKYDFIFTIKAKSNIIGGPSAGAAIAAITTIATLDLEYDNTTAITGTINSGGLIGPVGGVKEKIEAAAEVGLNKVLIAKGTTLQNGETKKSEENTSKLNLIDYGKNNLSIEVLEVTDLDEVIYQLTGINLNHQNFTLSENEEYRVIMNDLQEVLCERTQELEAQLAEETISISSDSNKELKRRKDSAANATNNGDYYSAASFCFGNNIDLKEEYYLGKKLSIAQLSNYFNSLTKKMDALAGKVNNEQIETIADLQSLMIVKERLEDVRDQIQDFQENSRTKPPLELYRILAYAEERYFSAESWMKFFTMSGKKLVVNKELLRNSCLQKISEGEERFQYTSIFLSEGKFGHIREKIATAKSSLEKEEFELCLITAAQAKADADAIISTLGLTDETVDEYILAKQKAVERILFENSAEGMFPILGYSYYQYAKTLRESDKYSALLYLEYALEMSDLGMYFPEEKTYLQRRVQEGIAIPKELLPVATGIILGIFITLFVQSLRKKKKHKKEFLVRKQN